MDPSFGLAIMMILKVLSFIHTACMVGGLLKWEGSAEAMACSTQRDEGLVDKHCLPAKTSAQYMYVLSTQAVAAEPACLGKFCTA